MRCQPDPQGVQIRFRDAEFVFDIEEGGQDEKSVKMFAAQASRPERAKAVAYIVQFGSGTGADEAADQLVSVRPAPVEFSLHRGGRLSDAQFMAAC